MKLLFAASLFISTHIMANQTDINTIESAFQQLNSQVLTDVASQGDPYIKALAHYRLSVIHNMLAKKLDAISSLNITINQLESIVATHIDNDEAWALLGQSYALMISYQPELGATYGTKSFNAIEQAIKANAFNPRTMLFQGIIAFNTPEIYGGSKSKAMSALNKAIELFNNDRFSENYWGEAEAYVWRGLTFQALNKLEKANADFTQALQIEPNLGWARMLLNNNS